MLCLSHPSSPLLLSLAPFPSSLLSATPSVLILHETRGTGSVPGRICTTASRESLLGLSSACRPSLCIRQIMLSPAESARWLLYGVLSDARLRAASYRPLSSGFDLEGGADGPDCPPRQGQCSFRTTRPRLSTRTECLTRPDACAPRGSVRVALCILCLCHAVCLPLSLYLSVFFFRLLFGLRLSLEKTNKGLNREQELRGREVGSRNTE